MNKIDLTSPAKKIEKNDQHYKSSTALIMIFMGIILCLIIIILFIILFPSPPVEKELNKEIVATTQSHLIKEQNIIEEESNNADESENNYQRNENIQIDWMLIKAKAENEKMSLWLKEDYEAAINIAEKAESLDKNKDYKKAEGHYKRAIEIIDRGLNNKELIFNELLAKGEKALNDEKLVAAKDFYLKAQLINSENETIRIALDRINNREKVNILYNDAINDKENNKLEIAFKKIEQILIIDPEYQKAKVTRKEIIQQLKNKEFNTLISKILTDIENKNLKDLRKNLSQAEFIKPEDPIISELKIRIDEKIKANLIRNYQTRAIKYETKEDWKNALSYYKKILKNDTNASNAIFSQKKVEKYIKYNSILDSINSKPDRLFDNKIFEQSKRLLNSIKKELDNNKNLLYPMSKTPKLANKLILSEKIIQDASIEINLEILSDNETDIVIYKVGKFGKLSNKTITLRAGVYTIVGSRLGYRDYRKKIKITGTQKNMSIVVECKEKI